MLHLLYSSKSVSVYAALLSLLFIGSSLHAQQQISGKVYDELGDPLIGATVLIVGTTEGSTSDLNGGFVISTEQDFPVELEVSYLGYNTSRVEVASHQAIGIEVSISKSAMSLDQVVVSASRYEQRLVTTPVSIEKLNSFQLTSSPTADFYETFATMRGVQANTGSMVFTSFNTRGFADPNNLRYIQQVDGMDITTPGYGVIGNTAGLTSLDIQSMELLPGSASALYGPDAFNGILLMYSKNPFDYPGLSAEVKTGITVQDEVDPNFYGDFSVRWAHPFSDKIALKLDLNHKRGTDWQGTDLSNRVTRGNYDNRDNIMAQTWETTSAYNAVNRYGGGDFGVGIINTELIAPDGSTETVNVTRTGLHDRDVFDGTLENYRINASLHYRPNSDWEITLLQKYAQNDFSFRITTFYPFQDFEQFHTKLEAKSKHLTFRTYRTAQRTNDTYIGFALGRTVENALKSDDDWIADFREEYQRSGNYLDARNYADRDLYDSDGRVRAELQNEFDALVESTINNNDPLQGGAGFEDNSSYWHTDLNYDFKNKVKPFRLQVGGNIRRYSVNSNGTFFNDHREGGFEGAINYVQYGVFTQISKNLLDNRLSLTGSIRYDKNENFDGNFTPRISATYGLDPDRNHNLRASYQTAFRNPGLQEAFFNFRLFANLTLMGTSRVSLERFTHIGRGTGTVYTGDQILDALGFQELEPEKNSTFELGYRGITNKRLLIDVNAYFSRIPNFITFPLRRFDPTGDGQDLHAFTVFQNARNEIISYGTGFSIEYDAGNNFRLFGNYNYNDFEIQDFEVSDIASSEENLRKDTRFNTPTSRFNVGISNSGFGPQDRFGFNVAFRWTSEYFYQSSFGETDIPSINNTDASVFMELPDINTRLTLSATNVFRQDYSYVYGGGIIGSMYLLGIRYTPEK